MKVLALAAILVVALSGCFQEEKVTKTVKEGMGTIQVADNVSFDFFQDVKVDIKGTAGTAVEIYAEKPAEGVLPIVSDLLDEDGNYSDEINVESNGTLYVVSPKGEFATSELTIVDGAVSGTVETAVTSSKKSNAAILNPEWVGPERRVVFEDRNTDTTDFDFNDVVVDYSYEVNNKYFTETVGTKTKQVKYVESALFDVRVEANGAMASDGFGIKFDGILASTVDSVTVDGNVVGFTGVGTDKVVIHVVEDISAGFGDKIVNTDPSKEYKHALGYSVVVKFKEKALLAKTQSSFTKGLNPFIFKSDNILDETHILGKTAVNDANLTPYKTTKGLPWAMELPTKVGYPQEEVAIIDAYPNFEKFATGNNDAVNKKWYKKPVKTKIYEAK